MATAVERASRTKRSRVLLADSDAVNLVHMEQLLGKCGYDVVTASSGPEVLAMLQSSQPPPLAVLGWSLPGLDGIEVCHQLRQSRPTHASWVVLLTKWGDKHDRGAALEAGADDILFKPVDIRELRLRLQVGSQTLLERALRESEQRFQSAFEHAGVGMALIKPSGEFLQTNQALSNFLGRSPGELEKATLQEVSSPRETPSCDELLEQFRKGTVRSGEFERRFLNRSGTEVWASLTISSLVDAENQLNCFVLQLQNIDDRIQAEHELQEAHAETELFLRAIPSILIGIDGEGKIKRWNLTASNTFGLAAGDVQGRSILDCGVQWRSRDMRTEVERWLRTDSSCRSEALSFDLNGKTRYLGLNISRVPQEDGENAGFIITGADVTERKQLEEQLRQAQKLEAIGQLSAGIAHEINTPTQYVSDNIRFLQDSWKAIAEVIDFAQRMRTAEGGPDAALLLAQFDQLLEKTDLAYHLAEIPNALEQSLDGLQRVATIVKAIKEFSHPGSEEKGGIDLNKALESTVQIAKNEWKYVAEVALDLQENLPLVTGLANELNQVFLNLLVNAAQAIAANVKGTKGKGTITIATRHDGEWAEVSIGDSGGGIPAEIKSRVFEPFFTTKPVGQGTGQGLALAHSVIVTRHQGKIWFESVSGEGTTFFIRLPLEQRR